MQPIISGKYFSDLKTFENCVYDFIVPILILKFESFLSKTEARILLLHILINIIQIIAPVEEINNVRICWVGNLPKYSKFLNTLYILNFIFVFRDCMRWGDFHKKLQIP